MSEEIKKQEGGEEMPISHVEINQDGVAEVEKPPEDTPAKREEEKEEGEKNQDDDEEEKPAAQTNGDITEEKEEGQEDKTASMTTSDDAPLTKILEGLDQLSEEQQQVVKNNLERISEYPRELPLSQSWTLHFSDTSGASKSSSAAATKDAYTEGINPVFVATTVPGLCGQLKAFKKAVRPKRAKPTDPDGLGLNRPGMNLHFFRTGISPTWEDPYNEKGGRLTISPPAQFFDPIYERLVLLLAGSSLELGTSELLQTEGPAPSSKRPPTPGPPQEGMIMGVVASRRARGDRIELWIGGKAKREPTPGDWIDRLKEVLADQLEMPELRTSKYKKHF